MDAKAPTESIARSAPHLGASHGYRFEDDEVVLHAEVLGDSEGEELELQLWATRVPYVAGAPEGTLLARSAVPPALGAAEARALLHAPCEDQAYTILLVLAHRADGTVLDVARYPAPQYFLLPRLFGHVHISADDPAALSLAVDGVSNGRPEDNLSGTLQLEVWAFDAPYTGGALRGQLLASHTIGRLGGQSTTGPLQFLLGAQPVQPGLPVRALLLTEWTRAGRMVRDFRSLPAVPEARAEAEKRARPSVSAGPFARLRLELAPTALVAALRRLAAPRLLRAHIAPWFRRLVGG